jgi:hypothetical protein
MHHGSAMQHGSTMQQCNNDATMQQCYLKIRNNDLFKNFEEQIIRIIHNPSWIKEQKVYIETKSCKAEFFFSCTSANALLLNSFSIWKINNDSIICLDSAQNRFQMFIGDLLVLKRTNLVDFLTRFVEIGFILNPD